jgi:hypothetical protein
MDAMPLAVPTVPPQAYVAAGPWTSFFVAVLFVLLFPLLPLGAELLFTGRITFASLSLVTATYAISLSMSSRNLATWALGFMVGFVFSTLFGWSMGLGTGWPGPAHRLERQLSAGSLAFWLPVVIIAAVFTLHLWERYVRHVKHKELYPDFLQPVR